MSIVTEKSLVELRNRAELKERILLAIIDINGLKLTVEDVWVPRGKDYLMVSGSLDHHDGNEPESATFPVIWDEEGDELSCGDISLGQVIIRLPTVGDLKKITHSLNEIKYHMERSVKLFNDLGFPQELVLLTNDNELAAWNSLDGNNEVQDNG